MGFYNKNILPLLGKYFTAEYHEHEFVLHILLRSGPKMPGLIRFFPLKLHAGWRPSEECKTWYNKENNCSTWNYSKTKQQTKTKLYYPFTLIIRLRDMNKYLTLLHLYLGIIFLCSARIIMHKICRQNYHTLLDSLFFEKKKLEKH